MAIIIIGEQIAELQRELAVRKNVYAKWVRNKRMAQSASDRQIGRLQAALETLVELNQFGRIQKAEFDGSGMPLRVAVSFDDRTKWYRLEMEE